MSINIVRIPKYVRASLGKAKACYMASQLEKLFKGKLNGLIYENVNILCNNLIKV